MNYVENQRSQIDGIQVFGFTDSVLALEHFKLNESTYTLVLSDFRMPTMNGIELLKEIKSIKTSVKTVLVSAFDVEDELFENCSCVDTFLQKPVTLFDLINAVETQIDRVCLVRST
jgi:DNA-binding NarL/FixJ family response regulator